MEEDLILNWSNTIPTMTQVFDGKKYYFGGTFPKFGLCGPKGKQRKFIYDYKMCIKANGGTTKVQVINGQVTFWNRW